MPGIKRETALGPALPSQKPEHEHLLECFILNASLASLVLVLLRGPLDLF